MFDFGFDMTLKFGAQILFDGCSFRTVGLSVAIFFVSEVESMTVSISAVSTVFTSAAGVMTSVAFRSLQEIDSDIVNSAQKKRVV